MGKHTPERVCLQTWDAAGSVVVRVVVMYRAQRRTLLTRAIAFSHLSGADRRPVHISYPVQGTYTCWARPEEIEILWECAREADEKFFGRSKRKKR